MHRPDDAGTILAATLDDLPAIAEISSAALIDDPVMRWIFGDGPDLHERLVAASLLWTGALISLGNVWRDANDAGMVAWIWPDDIPELYAIDLQIRPAMTALSIDGTRYSTFWDWIDGLGPTEPYCYLDQLCVTAAHRRHGVGSALLRHGIDRAVTEGMRCGLIARTPQHIAYFSRAGFTVETELHTPGGGPTLWQMFI